MKTDKTLRAPRPGDLLIIRSRLADLHLSSNDIPRVLEVKDTVTGSP